MNEQKENTQEESISESENLSEEPKSGMEVETKNETKKTSEPSKFSMFFAKIRLWTFLIAIVVIVGKNISDKHQEKEWKKEIYNSAADYLRKDLSDVANLKIESFDEDNVNFQRWDYYDFGYGRLRYAWYAVTVPCEYDAPIGHLDIRPNIYVYYYTSNQNIVDGIDESVPAHFHFEGFLDFLDF